MSIKDGTDYLYLVWKCNSTQRQDIIKQKYFQDSIFTVSLKVFLYIELCINAFFHIPVSYLLFFQTAHYIHNFPLNILLSIILLFYIPLPDFLL